MTDIAPIKGRIELEDDFTSGVSRARNALGDFAKSNQESLKAVAQAGALVVGALTAIGAATLALGLRGSAVNDLAETMDEFTGSAEASAAVMEKLRAGTRGTVDDFALAKDAAHLLSAGVKLTTEDFTTLSEASFVLANRGFGSTKEQLDLVSDAMVTGRTRSIAMMLGVVDNVNAEEDYAATLGITKDALSDAGRIESHRIEVMRLLNEATKSGATIQEDFGDRVDKAKVFVTNWIDKLGSAVDSSKVLAAGMNAIQTAIGDAFGTDQEAGIDLVIHGIERAAVVAVDFGLVAVEVARGANVAWSAIKTGVLGIETGLVGLADAAVEAFTVISAGAEKVHLVPPGTTAELTDLRTQLRAMTVDLAAQTAEAAKGVIGQSEFDATLDKVGGTLFSVRDAMVAASEETAKNADATDAATTNAGKLKKAQDELAVSMVNRQQVMEMDRKSLAASDAVWSEFYALQAAHGTSSMEAQKAAIQKWFDDAVGKLDVLDKNWQRSYDGLAATAKEKLSSIEVDWATLQTKSLDNLREQAQVARNTYNEMALHAGRFSRDAMGEQLLKVREAEDAARSMGGAYKKAFDDAAVAAAAAADETKRLADEAAKAKAINMAMGGSFEITRANFAATASGLGANVGVVEMLLKKGYSFQQALLYWQHPDWPPPQTPGPRVPGFAMGGLVDITVGESGPEAVRVPLGTQVFPTGVPAPGRGDVTIQNTFHVNGTSADVARKVSAEIMRSLRIGRQLRA